MNNWKTLWTVVYIFLTISSSAQPTPLTMERAVALALQQNKGLQSAGAQVDYYRYLSGTSSEVGKTEVALQYGQYNSYEKKDNNFSVTQTIPFPAVFGAKKQLNAAQVQKAEWYKASTKNELVYQVKQSYLQLLYLKEKQQLLQQQDSLFDSFARSAALRYRTGETALLQKAAAEGRLNEVRNNIRQNEADSKIYAARLQALLGVTEDLQLAEQQMPAVNNVVIADSALVKENPYLQYLQQQVTIAERQKKVFSTGIFPDITVGYFNQSLIGTPVNASGSLLATGANRFQGFQVGLALPLWFGPLQAKVKAEEQQKQMAGFSYEHNRINMESQYRQALQQYVKQQHNLSYYRGTALPNAALIAAQSLLAYSKGEIGYAEHFLNMEQVLGIRQGYLLAQHDAGQAIFYIEYLAGHQQ